MTGIGWFGITGIGWFGITGIGWFGITGIGWIGIAGTGPMGLTGGATIEEEFPCRIIAWLGAAGVVGACTGLGTATGVAACGVAACGEEADAIELF